MCMCAAHGREVRRMATIRERNGKYCVILPQQTNAWYELDTNTYVKATETAEVVGQTYFDKYTQNDGVYYTKVIKVQ